LNTAGPFTTMMTSVFGVIVHRECRSRFAGFAVYSALSATRVHSRQTRVHSRQRSQRSV